MTMASRATVVGLGVIGASIALALKRCGWIVAGSDLDHRHAQRALEQGVIDSLTELVDPDSEVVFVATPPRSISEVVERCLEATSCPISDVGSVKARIATQCTNPRFVPGHPMTGSE